MKNPLPSSCHEGRWSSRVPGVRLPYCLLVLLVLLAVASFTPAVSAEDPLSLPSVVVQDYRVSPTVLMPGENGMITVTLRSSASNTQTNAVSFGSTSQQSTATTTTQILPYVESVTLVHRDLRVLGGNGQFEGNIGPGQVIPISFLIQAPGQSGLYFPEVWIRIRGGQSVKYPVPVNVNTQITVMREPSITVDKDIPDRVRPGDTINGAITLTNTGGSRADNIRVTFNTSSLPIACRGTSTLLIDHLNEGEHVSYNTSFLVDKNAPLGLTDVPVQVRYTLIDGTEEYQPDSLGLDIRGVAELSITSVETKPLRVSEGEPIDLTIRVQNTGTGEAKSVAASVDLPFPGVKEGFIGKIKAGNDAPALFTLDGGRAGDHPYTVTITWTDDWGDHSFSRPLTLPVSKADGTSTLVVIIVLLAIGGFLGYRYWRGRKGDS